MRWGSFNEVLDSYSITAESRTQTYLEQLLSMLSPVT
jgi:hypothetical protein